MGLFNLMNCALLLGAFVASSSAIEIVKREAPLTRPPQNYLPAPNGFGGPGFGGSEFGGSGLSGLELGGSGFVGGFDGLSSKSHSSPSVPSNNHGTPSNGNNEGFGGSSKPGSSHIPPSTNYGFPELPSRPPAHHKSPSSSRAALVPQQAVPSLSFPSSGIPSLSSSSYNVPLIPTPSQGAPFKPSQSLLPSPNYIIPSTDDFEKSHSYTTPPPSYTSTTVPSPTYGVPNRPWIQYGSPSTPPPNCGTHSQTHGTPSQPCGIPTPSPQYGLPHIPTPHYGITSTTPPSYGVSSTTPPPPSKPWPTHGVPTKPWPIQNTPSSPWPNYGVPSQTYGAPPSQNYWASSSNHETPSQPHIFSPQSVNSLSQNFEVTPGVNNNPDAVNEYIPSIDAPSSSLDTLDFGSADNNEIESLASVPIEGEHSEDNPFGNISEGRHSIGNGGSSGKHSNVGGHLIDGHSGGRPLGGSHSGKGSGGHSSDDVFEGSHSGRSSGRNSGSVPAQINESPSGGQKYAKNGGYLY